MKNKFLATLLFLCFASNSWACTCFFSPDKKSIKDYIRKADVVIYAMVMPDSLNKNVQVGDSTLHVTEVVFKILKTWKGKQLITGRFKAEQDPCADAGYVVGERYIIFGYLNKETGYLETNNCNSLCEKTIPHPQHRFKTRLPNFDEVRFQKANEKMRKVFESVKKSIEIRAKKK